MDAAEISMTPEVLTVDKFYGMTFGDACIMLFGDAKSTAPQSEGFQSMMDYIGKIHVSMGLPFSPEEYWNEGTISGSFPVFPANMGADLNIVPAEITLDYLERMIIVIGELETASTQYRHAHETVMARARGPQRGLGLIDPHLLVRSVNNSPMFLSSSADSEEDDFI